MSYLLAFAGFALLIILHEAGHFVAAKAVGMRVERFALFFPPLIAKWRPKGSETEYGIGAIPLGGYVKISGMTPHEELAPEVAHRAYYRQPVWKRIVTIAAGPVVNIVLAFVLLWVLLAADGVRAVVPVVDQVTRGAPAAQALAPGDRILSVDGRPGFGAGLSPEASQDRALGIQKAIGTHRCAGAPSAGCRATEPVRLTVLRDGERRRLEITPRYDAQLEQPLLGFRFATRTFDVALGDAAVRSVDFMWEITTTTVDRIVRLFYDSEARKDVSGVVGSYKVTQEAFSFDTATAIRVLALISLSLGVINLFPFLPLDGGHIFWALGEKLRGRPIPFSVLERASIVGIMLVAFLFIVGFSNDLGRLTSGEGFGVR